MKYGIRLVFLVVAIPVLLSFFPDQCVAFNASYPHGNSLIFGIAMFTMIFWAPALITLQHKIDCYFVNRRIKRYFHDELE